MIALGNGPVLCLVVQGEALSAGYESPTSNCLLALETLSSWYFPHLYADQQVDIVRTLIYSAVVELNDEGLAASPYLFEGPCAESLVVSSARGNAHRDTRDDCI